MDFLQERHKNFNFPQNIIFDIVKKSTNTNPIKTEKIIAGYDSEIYSINTKENIEFIIRINRFGEIGFQNEAWAMNECRKVGVPVPEIFFNDNLKIENEFLEVMLISKLKGNPLKEKLKNLKKEELDKILFQAGEILSRINSIKVNSFYRRHKNGSWDFPNWNEMMKSTLKDRISEKEFILKHNFNENDFSHMLEMIEYYKDKFPCKQSVLCHGDYLPEHIFITKNNEISGIIDFGMIKGNAPIHDIAFLNFQYSKFDIESLKKGYKDKSLFDNNFDIKLNLHKLMLQIYHLAHSTKTEDIQGANFIAEKLKNTFEYLKNKI